MAHNFKVPQIDPGQAAFLGLDGSQQPHDKQGGGAVQATRGRSGHLTERDTAAHSTVCLCAPWPALCCLLTLRAAIPEGSLPKTGCSWQQCQCSGVAIAAHILT